MTSPHKKVFKHLPLAVVAILAVIATGTAAVSPLLRNASTASGAKARPSWILTPNNTANPPLSLSCNKPVFTIALSIDRSDLIVRNPAFAGKSQVDIIKAESKKFIDKLYQKIVVAQGGTVNVLLSAVATQAVWQNRYDAGGKKIVEINSDPQTLVDLQQDIENIYFGPVPTMVNPANPFGASNPADNNTHKYGYNTAGKLFTNYDTTFEDPAKKENTAGKANFDDALLEVAKEASTPDWNTPAPGQHIDMSLLLGSGVWPNWDHNNRTFEFKTDRLDDYSWNRLDPAIESVNKFRQTGPIAGTPYDIVQPIYTRAIFFKATSSVANELEHVWGNKSSMIDFAYQEDPFTNLPTPQFEIDLNASLQKVVDSVKFNAVCPPLVPTSPSIGLALFNSDGTPHVGGITLTEGVAQNFLVKVTNTWDSALYNIGLDVNGTMPLLTNFLQLNQGATVPKTWTAQIDLGAVGPPSGQYVITTVGETNTRTKVTASLTVPVTIIRNVLPS